MPRNFLVRPAVALAAAAVLAAPAAAQFRVTNTLLESVEVLDDLHTVRRPGIPLGLVADAEAVAVIPRVVKVGLVAGGRAGHGVVLVRQPDGGWGDPIFVNLGGASVGFQAGVSSTDVVLVFKTRKGLGRLLRGHGKLTLGVDAAVAAGPVGRQAEAATDARLGAEIFSYSRSRGLFAGVSLEGAALTIAHPANRAFASAPRPESLAAAQALKLRLTELAGGRVVVPGPAGPPVLGRPVAPPPPPADGPVVPAAPPAAVPDRPGD